MSFSKNLSQIMDFLKVSNSKLAKHVKVDPSLVSRWRSGNRSINANSPYLLSISEFIFHSCTYDYQKKYINEIIKSHRDFVDEFKKSSELEILSDWLVTYGTNTFKTPDSAEALSMGIINKISKLNSYEKNIQEPFDALPEITPGAAPDKCSFDIYTGNEGRRDAVISFLKSVLSSESKEELYLLSEGNMDWMTEDGNFLKLWAGLLEKVIENNHKITIIHTVNRDISELYSILTYWIPLHLKGKIKSYYFPRYVESRVKQTCFITKGKRALIAYESPGSIEPKRTFFYSDSVSTKVFEDNFLGILSQCKALLRIFEKDNRNSYFDYWNKVVSYPGSYQTIRNHFNPVFMDDQFIEKQFSNDKDIDFYLDLNKEFSNMINNFQVWDYVNLDVLEEITYTKVYRHPMGTFLSEGNITLKSEVLSSFLKRMISTLKENPNYNLCFYIRNQDINLEKLNIFYKQNSAATFNVYNRRSGKYISLVLDEINILKTFDYYFEDFKSRVPVFYKKKEEVIKLLQRAVDIVEGKHP